MRTQIFSCVWGLSFSAFLFSVAALAQDGPYAEVPKAHRHYHNWFNQSPTKDKVYGAEVDRTYSQLLVNKKPKKKIVVAVLDSGTDITHPDLQGRIWVNADEIPGNGVDDDNNGYVDDVHGWGLLGNNLGENVAYENLEYVRIYKSLLPIYGNVHTSSGLSVDKKAEFELFQETKAEFEKEVKHYQEMEKDIEEFELKVDQCETLLGIYLSKDKNKITIADLRYLQTTDPNVHQARLWLLSKYNQGFTRQSLKELKANTQLYLTKHLNLEYNPRTTIGDNPLDITDIRYGNANVAGPRTDHGTPVAGIIGAIRGNNTGIDGIAEEVELMILRTVPKGDERDKDIALSIRYAVDNGANIINMSFGKAYSPQKSFVDEAIKYAEQHNVLVVHAAGNDAKNLDLESNFPSKNYLTGGAAGNWIEVGATSMTLDKEFCGKFSNYGSKSVDLFAPGVDMISLQPNNMVEKMNGTSFAGPVVSGVAALVWSYYPELTALELRNVLLNSATVITKKQVYRPVKGNGDREKVDFASLSVTGGVVNAYQAMLLAEKTVAQKAQ